MQVSNRTRHAVDSELRYKRDDLPLRDRLAIDRTAFSVDRSLLAGVRTSVNFIGFGFTIYNVLRYLQEHTPARFIGSNTPRNFGIFMFAAGTVPLIVMMIQYHRIMKQMGSKLSIFSNPTFYMAFAVLGWGLLLATQIVNILLR